MTLPAMSGIPESGTSLNGKRLGGAPAGNRNALRHGLRAGKLPRRCQYVEHRVNDLRRGLEDAVVALRGGVGIVEAANINTAAKWERHGLLAQHWLRHEAENLTVTERLRFSEAIAKASAARDQAIKMLNLDADAHGLIDVGGGLMLPASIARAIPQPPAPAADPQADQRPSNATGAILRDQIPVDTLAANGQENLVDGESRNDSGIGGG